MFEQTLHSNDILTNVNQRVRLLLQAIWAAPPLSYCAKLVFFTNNKSFT